MEGEETPSLLSSFTKLLERRIMYYPKTKQKSLNQSDIKIFSLGGLGVVGMNMYVVEVNDEILVMDAGILFAGDEIHGVDYIIPDFTYLKQNESKIVGLFITHGHEDHIGAIPFLLQQVKIPCIYAAGIAVGLINNKLQEYANLHYKLEEYNDNSNYTFKNLKVSFFRTNHSIPDSYGIAIKTSLGYVVNTGDFKFDFNPIGAPSDYYKMTQLGHEGVLCMMADSTNAQIAKFSASEKKIGETLHNIFSQIEGRIIVATFASNVYRVQQIIEASIAEKRKIIVFGRSMEKTIDVASKLKYINAPRGWILSSRELNRQATNHITILCTGSQGEPMAALSRIANGTHKQIHLKPGDTVIYSSKPIPGNEQFINQNINTLVHAGANVIKNSPLTDIHTTGHASQNEMRMMLSFLQPKYFMPVHGEYLMLKEHAKIANDLGIKNTFVLNRGDVLTINQKGAKVIANGVYSGNVYLDSNLDTVDHDTILDRKNLASEGLIAVTYTISKAKKLLATPIVISKGFVDVNFAKDVISDISKKAKSCFEECVSRHKTISPASLENAIKLQLSTYIYQKIERKPLLLVHLTILDSKEKAKEVKQTKLQDIFVKQ
jgi:ribonuclease J